MNRCFTFRFPDSGRPDTHVHFVPPGIDDISAIVEEYVEVRRGWEAPGKVVFLGFRFSLETLDRIFPSPEFGARKAEISDRGECAFEVWMFDESGTLADKAGRAIPAATADSVRKAGFLEICLTREVVIETHASFHYVKPSGHHVDRFVRAANAMVRGSEVAFMAAWILQHLQREIRVVHCDTSGIAALAYAALHLKFLFAKRALPIAVTSFGSYQGLEQDALESPAACLALISASTSGAMAKLIVDRSNVPANAIVTVFYLGEHAPQGNVLCDLTGPRTPGGPEPARNQKEEECKLCARGSIPLRMEGDGFVPEPPKVTFCLIQQTHLPEWLHAFTAGSVPSRAVRCAVSRQGTDTTDEIYLDARKLIHDAAELKAKWTRLLSLGIPADVARIVFFEDDPASKAFALEIKDYLKNRTAKVPAMIGMGRNIPLASAELKLDGATVVAVSAIVKGRRITSVSRDLRDSPGPIIYLAGVSRTESAAVHRRIRSNLVKSVTGVEHALQAAAEIYLPPCRADSVSSWARERWLLEEWSNRKQLPDVIARRLDLLLSGAEDGERGFRNATFLPDLAGTSLRLRNNSIFFPKEVSASTVSQADVFFVISSVLHKLRSEPSGSGSLGRGIRHHALLDPANFERFTDGVIQAAFLRAALPIELDYAVDGTSSAHVLEFLFSMFRNLDAHGEAALEFAMAIATERLRLSSGDQLRLERQWGEDAARYPDPLRALIEFIRFGSDTARLASPWLVERVSMWASRWAEEFEMVCSNASGLAPRIFTREKAR